LRAHISLDTLRADRLGIYGYSKVTSPHLDSFAKRSVVFDQVVSVAPWTLPSHVSLFSGLFPTSHGVVKQKKQKIAPQTELLAELLSAQGFKTYGFTGGGYVSKAYGFSSGFEVYINSRELSLGGNEFGAATSEALKVLQTLPSDQRYFLFLHTYDIHCPYDPPTELHAQFLAKESTFIDPKRCGSKFYNRNEISHSQVDYLSAGYDGNIRAVDTVLGDFTAALELRGELQDTVIAITSDHGEEFFEHGSIGHKRSLHRELLHVPLIIYIPGGNHKRINASVSLVDVMPTLMQLLGLQPPQDIDGVSLLPLIDGQGIFTVLRQFQLSELDRGKTLRSSWGSKQHLIFNSEDSSYLMYNLTNDPMQKTDLAATNKTEAEKLKSELQAFIANLKKRSAPAPLPELPELQHEELEQLKTLGYL